MNLRVLIALLTTASVLGGCLSPTTTEPGTEGAACFPNSTCMPGLSCLSNLCVDARSDAGRTTDASLLDDAGVQPDASSIQPDASSIQPDASSIRPDASVAMDAGLPSAFDLYTLDPAAKHQSPISLAVKGDKLGVSYFVDGKAPDGGVGAEVRYVEFSAATRVAATPEKVAQVTNVFGEPSLAFDSKGAPHVAHLGPPSAGGSTFWFDSKAVVSSKSGGAWTSSIAVSVNGEVVGLYSTLAIDESDSFLVAYRDVNYGQFPVQDWQHSRLGFVTGRPGAWTDGTAVDGANRIEGHGALMSMVLANGRPAMTYSTMPGGAADTPRDVMFILRNADGTWPTNPIKVRAAGDTATGPSLAWNKNAARDQSADFVIAWRNGGQLLLTESMAADGSKWKAADSVVHGSGSGGWYPSAAFTAEGFPAVAYYVCSSLADVREPCPPSDNELLLAFRTEDVWQRVVVDPSGGHYTKLAYWNGRAVVAYRDTADAAIKLAIQR